MSRIRALIILDSELERIGASGNVLINEDADRVNSYNVWNYDEGHHSYYASMLVDLTLPPDDVRFCY